jgi:hypothetical protein
MDADDVNLPFQSDLEEKAVKLNEFKNRNLTDVREGDLRISSDNSLTNTAVSPGGHTSSFNGNAKAWGWAY